MSRWRNPGTSLEESPDRIREKPDRVSRKQRQFLQEMAVCHKLWPVEDAKMSVNLRFPVEPFGQHKFLTM